MVKMVADDEEFLGLVASVCKTRFDEIFMLRLFLLELNVTPKTGSNDGFPAARIQ
jgi:hypothetical protein